MNNLPKVVAQQRRGQASNQRLLDRKSDALPLSHRATPSRAWTRMFGPRRRPVDCARGAARECENCTRPCNIAGVVVHVVLHNSYYIGLHG